MAEVLFQGSKDIFLSKVRAAFDAVEDQALRSSRAVMNYSLIGSEPMADALVTKVSETTQEGSRAVWRHVATTGLKSLKTRSAGGTYPEVEFIRGYETVVYDPDLQDAGLFSVPDERDAKEASQYKDVLNRAKKLLYEIDRKNVADIFEIFNLAFTAPGSYAGDAASRFFGRGNAGLDGASTGALNEELASTAHARADGGATQSNASGNGAALDTDTFYAAKVVCGGFKDDVGKPFPTMGGRSDIVCGFDNVKVAKQLNESEWEIEVAENQINIHKGQFNRIITSPYLNESYYDASNINNEDQWHLVDVSNRDTETGSGLVCISYWPLETRVERNQDRDAINYKVKQNKVYGYTEWRNVYSSKGDGAAYTG